MITIEMGNVITRFKGLNNYNKIQYEIVNKLSYQTGGFGEPKKDNFLFNIQSNTTYTGLVPHILTILQKNNIKYKLNDKRIKPKQNANFNIVAPFQPREHQGPIIKRSSSRETIQAATGAGKTYIMAELIAKFNTKPVLVVAPKVSLALQIKDEFQKFLQEDIGIVGGGFNNIQDITICTPQSADDGLINRTKVLMFDEAHNLPSQTIFDIACRAKNAYYRIGVSATPWRDGGDDLLIEAALNIRKPHLAINASKLIKIGKLTPCNINFIKLNNSNIEWQGNYHKTYKKTIVNNEKRNNKIVDLAIKSVKNGRVPLILISKINHGEILLDKIKERMIEENINIEDKLIANENGNYDSVSTIEFVSGNDDLLKRKLVFDSVKKGFTKILIGSTIADEGLDITILDTLILAGAGKSSTRAFQRIGRVLRLHDGKEKAIVYDFMDMQSTFYKQYLYRKALYETEPLWKINHV